MNDFSTNSAVIERELDWLREVIETRLALTFGHRPPADNPPSPLFHWPSHAGDNGHATPALLGEDGNPLTPPDSDVPVRIHAGDAFEVTDRQNERIRIRLSRSGESGWLDRPSLIPEWFVPGMDTDAVSALLEAEPENLAFRQWIDICRRLTRQRMAHEQGDISFISPPRLPRSGSNYAGFVQGNKLSYADRLLLALGVCPHLRPDLLDKLLVVNDPRNDRPLAEAGGVVGQNFRGMCPTGLTWLFLLAGEDIRIRIEVLGSLTQTHALLGQEVLHFGDGKEYEPILRGAIIMDQLWLRMLIVGDVERKPKESPTA